MKKKLHLFIVIIILLTNISCIYNISTVERESGVHFKVNDPDASFFDVQDRIQIIKNSEHLNSYKKFRIDCTKFNVPDPVNYYLTMPEFYKDKRGWKNAYAPLESFERQLTELSELYVSTGDETYAHCIIRTLSKWAENDSLLSYAYGDNKQAWFAIEWTTSTAGLVYSVIRKINSIDPSDKDKIEKWLNKVARKQISYPGGTTSCCNNHSYWRGLQATIVGVVTNDDYLFRFGISKFINAIMSMNDDGSLPLEMDRGKRAMHYQNFSILPLVYIAEIADRQGYDLYSLTHDGKNLHLAIDFLLKSIKDQNIVKKYTKETQDLSFYSNKNELNWVEPYYRRFQNQEINDIIVNKGPFNYYWTGGSSTLYFR